MNDNNLNNGASNNNDKEIIDSSLLNPFQTNVKSDISNDNASQINSNTTNTNYIEVFSDNSKSESNTLTQENTNNSLKQTIGEEIKTFDNSNSIPNENGNMSIEENIIVESNNDIRNEQYGEERLNSLSKTLKNDMLTFAVLQFAVVVLQILLDVNYVSNTIAGVYFAVYILCYLGAKNQKSYAGKVGIIISILMILSIINRDILDFVLGIVLLSHSIKYTKAIKANGKNEKDLKYILAGIGVIVLVAGISVFVKLQGGKLQCTRKNGDKIVVKFDSAGISNYNVNGKDTEPILYETHFLQDFLHAKQTQEDYLTAFKNIVKKYEESNGATCK